MRKKNQTENRNLDHKLRDVAEGKLAQSPGAPGEMQGKTLEEVIHELQVHQIELEMQNEELRKSQLALEESRKRYQDLYDFAPVGYLTFTREALIKEVNLTGATLLGVARQKLINRRFRWFIAPSDFELWDPHFLSVLQEGEKRGCDLTIRRQDGSTFDAGLESIRMEVRRGVFEVHTVVTDITERKQAEEILGASEQRYRDLVENSQDLICTQDLEGKLLSVNEAAVNLSGYSREALLNMNLREFLAPEVREQFGVYLDEIRSKGQASGIMRVKTAAGETRYWEFNNTLRTEGVDSPIVRGMAHDVTERRLTEKKLKESEEQYRTAIESSNDGVAIVEGEALRFVNQKFLEMFGYEQPDEVLGRPFQISLHPDDREKVADYNRRRQQGETVPTCYEFKGIRKDGEFVYIEASSAAMPFHGKFLTLAYLRDITDKKKAQARLEYTLKNLRKAISGIIQVISQTVETRDPYTAGHQQRVADLARAIAQEMGLDADRVDGLRMAGVIHDLGKVSIPAEILSKPTQLREIEFQLIRTHPQVGYDILRDIELPWPIATIILQHHERLDGSGYPRGLKGEDISLEARILAVADVVEAMASYRPYRPALGIEAALEEIEKNKGILYDSRVVETCSGLFREKGFSFK